MPAASARRRPPLPRWPEHIQDLKMWYYYDMVEAANEHGFTTVDDVEIWEK